MLERPGPKRTRRFPWVPVLAATGIALIALSTLLGAVETDRNTPDTTTVQLPVAGQPAEVTRLVSLPLPPRKYGHDAATSRPAAQAPLPTAAMTLAPAPMPAAEVASALEESPGARPEAPATGGSEPVVVATANGMITKRLALPALPPVPAMADETTDSSAIAVLELEIRPGDTLDELFADNGLSRSDLARLLSLDQARKHLQLLRPGDRVVVQHENGAVAMLERIINEENTLRIERVESAFTATTVSNPVERRQARAHGKIESSLFRAAQRAGVSDTLIMNLAGIFAWDIDFVLDIRSGDHFTVVYEEIWQDGEKIRDGEILAAHFNNDGNDFRAVRFTDSDGNTGYFTPEGLSVRKAFLRAPIAISPRVTSSFNPRRMHPVHKRVRPHKGVDYHAPTGTPIKAAGDGKVIFRGRKGGYGNTVILQHGGNITTLYAHLSRFHRSSGHGRRVKQGQIIGYSGATGTVTAAHLHYEYRVNGVHRNPRTVKLPQARPVASKHRAAFELAATPLLHQLDIVQRTIRLAAGDPAAAQ